MSSRGWFTVPTAKEKQKMQKQTKRAKEAAERGEDFGEALKQDRRELERQAMREEAARIEAIEKAKRAHHAKEQRKQADTAARQRKQEAVERTRLAKDVTTWQVCTDRIADRSAKLCGALDALFDANEYGAHVSGNAGTRIEYAMALADREVMQTTSPAGSSAPQREPLLSFVELCSRNEGAAAVKAALQAQFDRAPVSTSDLIHACAALFGPRGNKVLKYENGSGLGARLVLQFALTRFATEVAANLDVFTTLFFTGAAKDKSSAALTNLVFVLDQVTGSASVDALRNAIVAVSNNAAGLDVPAAVLAKVQPWFASAVARVENAPKGAGDTKPLLFSPAAAALVVAAFDGEVAPAVIVRAGVEWNDRAGTHLIGSLLKRVARAGDSCALTVVAMIQSQPALANQLTTSVTSAPSQVNAVLVTCQDEGVGLPRDVAASLKTKASTALGGKGKASSAEDYAATSKLLKGVKSRKSASGSGGCGCMKWFVAIGIAGIAAGCTALHLGGPDAQRLFLQAVADARVQAENLAKRAMKQ